MIFGAYCIVYLSTPMVGKLMKSMGSHGSLITNICGEECDGLTLCEQLLEGYDCTHGYVTFELLLLGFLCCFIDI